MICYNCGAYTYGYVGNNHNKVCRKCLVAEYKNFIKDNVKIVIQ